MAITSTTPLVRSGIHPFSSLPASLQSAWNNRLSRSSSNPYDRRLVPSPRAEDTGYDIAALRRDIEGVVPINGYPEANALWGAADDNHRRSRDNMLVVQSRHADAREFFRLTKLGVGAGSFDETWELDVADPDNPFELNDLTAFEHGRKRKDEDHLSIVHGYQWRNKDVVRMEATFEAVGRRAIRHAMKMFDIGEVDASPWSGDPIALLLQVLRVMSHERSEPSLPINSFTLAYDWIEGNKLRHTEGLPIPTNFLESFPWVLEQVGLQQPTSLTVGGEPTPFVFPAFHLLARPSQNQDDLPYAEVDYRPTFVLNEVLPRLSAAVVVEDWEGIDAARAETMSQWMAIVHRHFLNPYLLIVGGVL